MQVVAQRHAVATASGGKLVVPNHVWSIEERYGTLGFRGYMNAKSVGVGIGLGLCFGAALGAGMSNVGVGVAFGVGIGVAFAMAFGASDVAPRTQILDKPLPNPLGLFERDQPN